MKVVILAAGEFPTHPLPLAALREADFVVCCDSAYEAWLSYTLLSQPQAADSSPNLGEHPDSTCRDSNSSLKLGRGMPVASRAEDCEVAVAVQRTDGGVCRPFVVIGDGDSLTEETKRELGNRWIHVDEQDYNDLHKAMAWATAHYPLSTTHFTILAATGKREDHTLGNISYLVTFAEEYPGADIQMITNHGTFIAMRGSRTFDSFPRQQISIFTPDPATAVTSRGLRWPLQEMHPRLWWQATLNEPLGTSFTLSSDGWIVLFRTHAPKA